jgi:hypothetical protein
MNIDFTAFASRQSNSATHGRSQSLSPKHHVQRPTTSDMRPWMTAMIEEVGVVAVCMFHGLSQRCQVVEGTAVVDALGQATTSRPSAFSALSAVKKERSSPLPIQD